MRSKGAEFTDPNKFISNPGSDEQIIYDSVLNDDGKIVLKERGKESISQYINSQREQTDMSYIITRIQLGDLSVLDQSKGVFGDFSKMPKTYAEMLQLRIDAENAFNRLPAAVKKNFDNNFNKWFADAGSEDWNKFMNPDTYKESEVVVEKVASTEE